MVDEEIPSDTALTLEKTEKTEKIDAPKEEEGASTASSVTSNVKKYNFVIYLSFLFTFLEETAPLKRRRKSQPHLLKRHYLI